MTNAPADTSPLCRLALLAGLTLLHPYNPACAQPAPKALRWGGDAAGGAPFIYGPENARVGFEVELADYLGKRIGRKPVFVQADWDALPDTLSRGNIDVALNGMEYLPEREKDFASTVPYFVYTLRLIARKADDSVKGWDDLKPNGKAKKRVGVLRGSVAERYVRDRYGDDVEVVPTREVDETFQLVEGGERLDVTVQDSPAAAYYVEGGKLPKLKVVGEPAAPGYYVVLTRKDDAELREGLNAAIREGLRSGELERIYRKYNLWSKEQEKLRSVAEGPWPPPAEETPESPGTAISLSRMKGAIATRPGSRCRCRCARCRWRSCSASASPSAGCTGRGWCAPPWRCTSRCCAARRCCFRCTSCSTCCRWRHAGSAGSRW